MVARIRRLAEPAIGLVLPRHCEHCQEPAEGWLCDDCAGELRELVEAPRCSICAYPLADATSPCPRCLGRERRVIRRVARLGVYDGVLRDLVLRMKFGNRWMLAEELGRLLAGQSDVAELLRSADVLVPVPLFWFRQLGRGYNQAELLARVLAGGRGIPVVRALRRVRHTEAQSTLRSVTARARNMRGAFALRGKAERLRGMRVVLVDDVMTTGATLRVAAQALGAAGPTRVDAIVLTLADPRGRDFRVV